MDQIIINDLHACINCLGYLDQGIFIKDVDTNVSIRDILRHLRRESNKCEVRLELSNCNVIEKCLIPLLKYCNEDSTLFDLLIRLMMNLTQPAFICFKQQLPEDLSMSVVYSKVNDNLTKYKHLFANEGVLTLFANCLSGVFEKEWVDRLEEEHMLVERVLILMRNVLHINTTDAQAINGTWSQHDRLLSAMLDSGWTELLVYLANTDEENRFAFHTLEIVSLMFREQTAETMKMHKAKPNSNIEKDTEKLSRLIKQDEELRIQEKARINLRALRYDGVFELTNVKSSSGLPMVYMHDISSGTIDLNRGRNLRKKRRDCRPIIETISVRQSAQPVVEKLQEFCHLFLEHGYNTLMDTARNYLVRNQMQPDDETYYLWSLKFFTSVCRMSALTPDYVSETMKHEVFHWVYEQAMQYVEMAETDKKMARGCYRKLQLAISAYNELLRFILMLDKHGDKKYQSLSVHIKGSVFYREEYMAMYPLLLHKYKESLQSRVLLRDLIEGSCLIIKILENHKSFDMNVVQTLKKKRKAPKKKTPTVTVEGVEEKEEEELTMPSEDQEELCRIWDRISDIITAAVNGQVQIPDESSLPCIYDATLPDLREPIEPGSEPVDVQLKKALGIVQILLRQEKAGEALAVLRLARTMWPDEERIALPEFEDGVEEEISMLKTLLLAPKFYAEDDLKVVKKELSNEDVYDDAYDDEAEFDEEEYETKEVLFDLHDYMYKFTEPNIVKTYGILFNEVFSNPTSTNRSLLRLMHRIAVKMRIPVVLYQLRLFAAFSKFLKDPKSKTTDFKEERKFVLHILASFRHHVGKNRKIFVEMVFSKNPKHLLNILSGEKIADENKKIWTERLDEELERLYEEVKEEEPLPGCDMISMIENRFSDASKTRRQIIMRMSNLGLIDSASNKTLTKKSKRMQEKPWTGEEQARLIVLVEEYKDEPNAIRFIMNGMKAAVEDPSLARSQRVVVKRILELGLVSDKTQLGIKVRERKNMNVEESEDNEDESDQDKEECGSDNEQPRERRVPPPLKLKKIVDWTAFKMTFARLVEKDRHGFVSLLVENIDLRANGIIGPLSLIPLLDDEIELLASNGVNKLLAICHFLCPDSAKGENFWRIPEDMGSKELEYFRNCAVSLTDDELEALTMTSLQENIESVTVTPSREEKITKKTLNIREILGSDSEDNNDDVSEDGSKESEEEGDEIKRKKGQMGGGTKIGLFESDEDESVDEVFPKKRKRIFNWEDDEESGNDEQINKKKRMIADDSD